MSRVVRLEEFREIASQHSRWPHVQTKAWKTALRMAVYNGGATDIPRDFWYSDQYPKSVDFAVVRAGIRQVESGAEFAMTGGARAWDIIAAVNNEPLSLSDPDYIIEWTPHIHPDFRNGLERRERAAERLQAAYSQLGKLAAAH